MRKDNGNQIYKLLQETNETYYWMGFLLADGGFNVDNFTVKFCLAKLDKEQVIRFHSYLNLQTGIYVEKRRQNYAFTICNKEIISQVIPKFDIKRRKTYNPPDLEFYKNIPNDLILSLIIGFIDGDGAIQKQTGRDDCVINIKNHSTWINFLDFIRLTLQKQVNIELPPAMINNQGYAKISMSNLKVVRFLKKYVINKSLPVLKRKWDKIDENRISKIECKQIAIDLFKTGKSIDEITELLPMKKTTIEIILRKNGFIPSKRYDSKYITVEQRSEILKRLMSGESYKNIALEYNVPKPVINSLKIELNKKLDVKLV